jgi:hypothetical protein
LDEDLYEPRLEGVLVGLLALILRGAVDEYRPLFDKLTPERQRTMERLLGVEFADELSRRRALIELPDVRTWFSLRVRAAHRPLDRSIDDLFAFSHVQDWVSDELRHATKREALEMKADETSELTVRRNALKKERAECQELLAWSEEDEEAFEAALEEIKTRTTALKAEKKKLLMRTRKNRLYPINQQKKTLRQFFGTCRWTYNQAVDHFRATSEANANLLTTLYVTKTSAATRRYPDGMSPPPERVFNTPSSMRNNVMRTF